MLVNCVLYQSGRKIRDIPVTEINQWIGRGDDSFVWVALKDATDEELAAMQTQFGLHELAVEDARHGHQRPKIEEYGDSLFVVLQLVGKHDNELQIGEVDIFVGRDYVLSVRARSEQGFLGVRARAEREPHLLKHGPSFVLYALMDAVVDRYFPVIDALEEELEQIEARIFEKGAARESIERLYELKNKMITLRHAVVPLLEAIGRLYGGRVPEVCQTSQDYFRDVADHLQRLTLSLDAMRETISTAIHVNLSMVTIEQSDIAKRLAGWAAIFAVATFFVGIWGMNFEFMPELKWKYGYVFALGIVGGVCGLLYRRFRKARWL
ncbi:MAG TPA: magnesium/cobalt transporter CorA [Burkholderiaceae bacterium]|nr:magnesium/cobalt transporter CorA [Burkholderiaceae bacterium]